MSMEITVNNPITIDYINRGNALVRHILVGDDNDPSTPHLEFINKTAPVNLAPGKYACLLFSRIYALGALGRLCDSDLMINGQNIATVHTTVPDGKDSDTAVKEFTLTVI
jgi:hypothetical protein